MEKKVFKKKCKCGKEFYGFTKGQVESQLKIHKDNKHKEGGS